MSNGQMPPEMPRVFDNSFSVAVRLLDTPHGSLLLETPAQINARYDDYVANLEVEHAGKDEHLAKEKARAEMMRTQEKGLFADVEKARAGDIQTFTFTFHVPTTKDVEAAEAAAAVLPPGLDGLPEETQKAAAKLGDALGTVPVRLRPVFRQALANATLQKHDLPGFPEAGGDFADMRADMADFVTRQVAQRIYFSRDVRSFLG